MKKPFVIMVLLLSAALVLMWQDEGEKNSPASQVPYVAVTTFALYDVANAVAGGDLGVEMVVPLGVDVHSFEPTPKLLARLEGAELLIYSGAGLEPWAATLADSAKVFDISRFMALHASEEEGHDAHEEHDCHHGEHDPHYWLDIDNMKAAASQMARLFSQIDPAHTQQFAQRTEIYIGRLNELSALYDKALASCAKKRIVVNHNAFGYLAERYGFEVHAISGLSPEAMPSAKTMTELSDLIAKEGMKVLFFESFVSDRLVKSLADESGAAVDVLQTLANITPEQAATKEDYISLMRQNLEKLSFAMECK